MNYIPNGTKWRFLLVEDNQEIIRQISEIAPMCVDSPDEAEIVACKTFKLATEKLRNERFDLLILDLKDDSSTAIEEETEPAGLDIFEALKEIRFIPVVFYTALAHLVRSRETSFVRVVEKTEDVTRVKDEIRHVLKTRLPKLTRHIEELERDYMWDFVNVHWKDFESSHEQADIAYLLARRLANALQKSARRMARQAGGQSIPIADPNNIHPMEMYIHPSINKHRQAGDILKGILEGHSGCWIVLTPSCDFEQQDRIQNILLAECVPLESSNEFRSWRLDSKSNLGNLKSLIGDNRADAQSERYKFLPGTFFIQDSVVDFQKLFAVLPDVIQDFEVVASLDSPFSEALLARFSRYFGRLGTPDIDKNVVINRLRSSVSTDVKKQATPPKS